MKRQPLNLDDMSTVTAPISGTDFSSMICIDCSTKLHMFELLCLFVVVLFDDVVLTYRRLTSQTQQATFKAVMLLNVPCLLS